MKKAIAAPVLTAALLASLAALRAQEGTLPAVSEPSRQGATPQGTPTQRAPTAAFDPRAEVEALLAEHAAAWSRGDLEAFCSVYAEDVLFLSPSEVTRGRQAVLARYRERYPDRAAMGTLTLETIEARLAGVPAGGVPAAGEPQGGGLPAAITVAGRWKLSFPGREPAEGLTLVVLHRRDGRWQIVQDASM